MHYISPEHNVVAFEGVDALAFLQSQLTNDVAALVIGAWQWQGYCNAKGRLHATFALARTGEAAFHAVVHSSTASFLLKRLTMFRLRSRVTITLDESLGVVHHFAPPEKTEGTLALLDLGYSRWVEIRSRGDAQNISSNADSIARWARIGIESNQPEIVSDTNEMFVPQMIDFDSIPPSGGISFSKGCYPGQEVVARAHYRGAVKRHLALQTLENYIAPGATFTREDGTEVDIVNIAPAQNEARYVALVVEPIATP